MEKRIKKYIEYLEELNFEELSPEERKALKEEALVQIGFFQHERLVHLIVMALVAILVTLGMILVVISETMATLIFTALLIVLLIPYIRFYWIMENGVQTLYKLYDRI